MSFPIPIEYDLPDIEYNNGDVITLPPSLSGDGTGVNLSQLEKDLILTLFSKAAYAEDDASTAYDTLENLWAAPQKEVDSITAVYTQSGTVYDTDTLDSLKSDLVVTANYSDATAETVPASDYILSGTLTVGTSTITVSYVGKTCSFNVTVTQSPLYPLTTGEKIWTSEDRKVSVRDGNIVKGELRSGGSCDMHANISWLSLNGSAPNNVDNGKVGTSKLFTIPSGSSVSIKVTPLTVQYEDAQIGGRSTNIAMRDSTGTNLHTLLATTAYNTLTVGTPVTDSFTASADLDVWNITMWMQAYSGNKTCTLELEIELTVDGVRFI